MANENTRAQVSGEEFPEEAAKSKGSPRRRVTNPDSGQNVDTGLSGAVGEAEGPGADKSKSDEVHKPRTEKGEESGAGNESYKPPADAADLADLFVDTGQGDPLTETTIHAIPVDKPKDFFRVHPDPTYRQRCYIYTHKIEGQIEERHYIVAEPMRDKVPEAKLCLLATCIYRDGNVRLWPLKLPQEGGKDQLAWSTARAAAKNALTVWTKLIWKGGKYETRNAREGYAPNPDLTKIPPYARLIALAFGSHGVIRDETHPVYLDQILGAAEKQPADDLDL
jgi:hypothetical protein